jgi:hypothetical protein
MTSPAQLGGDAPGDEEVGGGRREQQAGCDGGGGEARREHVGDEGCGRQAEVFDDDEVGRVARWDGDRGAVSDGDGADEQWCQWGVVAAVERDDERDH